MITLISGGVKSGKSGRALDIARGDFPPPVSFIATAEGMDEEMRDRIRRHQAERAGGFFITIEEPLDLDRAVAGAGPSVVVDCVSLWINNLIYHKREEDFPGILEAFIRRIPRNCVIVTNETGLGNIPFDENTRRYNLLLAEANRKIAAAADTLEFMVAGIPLRVK
ncbi:MAG: bifunctional adenosylcobinamide kinase/adenosylcobinamide-phosphate guanylyltransferase [Spirochaetaceae bacterium]|jgi:adenosylcobinamide kinase/adenosylcobinamide-phosphate guanylyltransferase|nr:bifunctional adenosylcobinamide kinase/adenosylcobinamide-phosphate guanylyltransferase [Spirochaetaceae bacterium]